MKFYLIFRNKYPVYFSYTTNNIINSTVYTKEPYFYRLKYIRKCLKVLNYKCIEYKIKVSFEN